MSNYKVYIQDNPAKLGKDLYILEVDINGKPVAVAEPIQLTMKKLYQGTDITPTLAFGFMGGDSLLYALKDALTDASLGHTQGELKATKEHLADMKRIAYKKLGIEEGEK